MKTPTKHHFDLKDKSEATFIKPTEFQPAPSLENKNQASEFYKTHEGAEKFRLSRDPWL